MLPHHPSILAKLDVLFKSNKIPNIIFHGPSGCGKSTLANDFVRRIYEKDNISPKDFVMYVNCSHGIGIKFIRDDVKFFAKSNVISSNGDAVFKTILLKNADKLTSDAQSALRRCIELFAHNTRFFIIVEDQTKMMNPILSRFCSIYISGPIVRNTTINLHKYYVQKFFPQKTLQSSHLKTLAKKINSHYNTHLSDCSSNDAVHNTLALNMEFSNNLYENGYNSIEISDILEKYVSLESQNVNNECIGVLTNPDIIQVLFVFHKMRHEIRHEQLMIFFLINCITLGLNSCLNNISFM